MWKVTPIARNTKTNTAFLGENKRACRHSSGRIKVSVIVFSILVPVLVFFFINNPHPFSHKRMINMPPRECQLEYIPCYFEFKSKWPFAPIIIWMLVGTVCVFIFSIIISTLQETIDLLPHCILSVESDGFRLSCAYYPTYFTRCLS